MGLSSYWARYYKKATLDLPKKSKNTKNALLVLNNMKTERYLESGKWFLPH